MVEEVTGRMGILLLVGWGSRANMAVVGMGMRGRGSRGGMGMLVGMLPRWDTTTLF